MCVCVRVCARAINIESNGERVHATLAGFELSVGRFFHTSIYYY